MTQRPRNPHDPTRGADEPKVARDDAGAVPPTESENEGEARLADWLVRIAGDHLNERIDPNDPAQAQFFEWCARDARAAQTPAERQRTARDADEFARDMLRRSRELVLGGDRETMPVEPATVIGAYGMREEPAATLSVPRVDARGRRAVREAALDHRVARFPFGVAAGVGQDVWDEPADAWIDLPPDVPAGEHVALLVRGDSMAPMLEDGDTILVRLRSDITVGDVIVARRPDDGYVVKRVARVRRRVLVLSSCNPAYPDVEVPNEAAFITGTVVLRWRAPR